MRQKRLAVASLAIALLSGCASSSTPETAPVTASSPTPSSKPSTAGETPAQRNDNALLHGIHADVVAAKTIWGVLPIAPADRLGTFSRDLFTSGRKVTSQHEERWPSEIVALGCTSTEAVLLRDRVNGESAGKGCRIRAGKWVDPYSGASLTDETAQVGYVIPLEEVWRSGGSAWNAEQRAIYANSTVSLVTSSKESTRSMGSHGAAEWRPKDVVVQCYWAVRYIEVKNTFGLSFSSAKEKEALGEMLAKCGDDASGALPGQSASSAPLGA